MRRYSLPFRHPNCSAVVLNILILSFTLYLATACSNPSDPNLEKTLDDVWPTLSEPWTGDLDGMIERGEIRLLTTISMGHYFIDNGKQRGILYEHAINFEQFVKKRFGKEARNLKLTIIPVRRDQLLPLLVAGYGDIAAAQPLDHPATCQPQDNPLLVWLQSFTSMTF